MDKQKRYVGIGAAVIALGAVGLFGLRLGGRAGGEGPEAMGCGGEPSMRALQETAPAGAPAMDVVAASQKPLVDTSMKQVQPFLEARHLTAQHLAFKRIWDEDGKMRVLFQQVHNGLPIFGAEAMVTLGPEGNVLSTEQRLMDDPTPARVTREMAVPIAHQQVSCSACIAGTICPPCIVSEPKDVGLGFQMEPEGLAYRVTMKGAGRDGQEMELVVFVDATTHVAKQCTRTDLCAPQSYVAKMFEPSAATAAPVRGAMAEPPAAQPVQPTAPMPH